MQANTAANGPPLNTADVYPLIVASATQDANVVQQAYGKLKQAEIRPGFFTALFEIMCQRAYINNQGQLHDHARQIAIIYFKNGVDRYWRKRARNGISEQEKQILRREFVGLILSESSPVAYKLLCEMTAKTVRLDWPTDCPELLSQLIQGVTDPNTVVASSAHFEHVRSQTHTQAQLVQLVGDVRLRALKLMGSCVKVMASKVVNKRQFREISGQLFMGVYGIWLEKYRTPPQGDASGIVEWCGVEARTCLKLMRKLLLHGFGDIKKVPDSAVVMATILEATATCEQRARQTVSTNQISAGGARGCDNAHNTARLLMKILVTAQAQHPFGYIPYIAHTCNLAVNRILEGRENNDGRVKYVPGEGERVVTSDDYLLLCLTLVKNCLCEVEYQDEESTDAQAAKREVSSVLTNQMVDALVRVLVGQYFLLTTADLDEWRDSPEAFAMDAADLTLLEVRPCAEALFGELVCRMKQAALPAVTNMIMTIFGNSGAAPCDPSDLQSVLIRDAVYNAIGMASYDIHDTFDFKSFLVSTVLPDLKVHSSTLAATHPATDTAARTHSPAQTPSCNYYSIIRRRVAWLLMQWSDACVFTEEEMQFLYVVVLTLHAGPNGAGLGERGQMVSGVAGGEDLLTRLTANSALRVLIDSVAFRSDSFEPFITPTISAVFSLLTNTDEDETRMRVLQSLAVVLQRCRHQLSTVALNADGSPGLGWEIAKVLFQLWEEATDHHLYQVCLVGNISSLVESMGKSVGASVTDGNANEICLLNPLCQIIATCSDVTNPAHVYLLDDSVLLWKRVVRQLDAPQIPILNVYPRTISLIENVGSEVVRDVMAVLRSYLLVIPDLFFPGSKQVPLVAMATTSPAVASAAESIGQTHVYNLCERLVQALAAWKDSGCKLIVDFIDCALVIGGVGVARGPMRSVVVAMATRMLAENQSDGTDVLVSFSLILARIAVQLPTEDLCSILAEAVVATKNIQIQNDTQNGPVNVASGVEGDRSAAARATMDSFANTSSHATHPGAKRIPTHINTQEEATSYGLCVLLKGWVRRLDQTSSYHSRKLIGLAAPVVLELVARRDAQVLAEEFPMVIDALVSIFGSLANENGSDDCLVMNNDLDTWAPEPGELGETSRERLMQHNDAVYRMSLKNTIQTRMTGLANTDQNGFQNLLSTVSPPVQKQFAELMQ